MAKARTRTTKKRKLVPCLTLNEIRFCRAYFAGDTQGNATRSYINTFKPENENAARQAASELLTKPDILAYLKRLEENACEAEEVDANYLVKGFKWAASADVTEMFDEDWNLLPKKQWSEALRHSVQSLKVKPIYEDRPDPDDTSKVKRVKIGAEVEVRLENKTDNRKSLAMIIKLIGPDAAPPQEDAKPLVVKGADPDKL